MNPDETAKGSYSRDSATSSDNDEAITPPLGGLVPLSIGVGPAAPAGLDAGVSSGAGALGAGALAAGASLSERGRDEDGTVGRVESALAEDGRLGTRAAHIGIVVDNGVVTLSGAVSASHERETAEKIAMNVSGVVGVNNELTVG